MFRLIIKGIFFGLIFFMLFAGCRQTRNTGGTINNTAEDTPENNNLTETTVIAEETTANSVNIKSDPRLSTFKMVSTGRWFGYTLAIKTDGSLWSWGYNRHGQLGDGTREDRLSPVRIGADNDWVFASAGDSNSAALKTDGSLWVWGTSDWNSRAITSGSDHLSPVRIGTDNDWASVSAGNEFTVAIKTDGSMWSWGINFYTNLGNGTTGGFENNPIRIGQDNDWKFVSAGERHSLAIKKDGSLWTWGEITGGPNGETERNRVVEVTRPTQIGTATNWVSAAAGYKHSAAIKADGTLWAWGYYLSTQVDNGGKDDRVPAQIGTDTDWLSVSASQYSTMLIKTNGSLCAFGTVGTYVYADPYTLSETPLLEYSNVPVRIWGETSWAYMSASRWYALAIMADGSLWAWGKNDNGQLGDGTTTDRLSPVQIGFAEESGIK